MTYRNIVALSIHSTNLDDKHGHMWPSSEGLDKSSVLLMFVFIPCAGRVITVSEKIKLKKTRQSSSDHYHEPRSEIC
jgi:hypothetical protein